MAYDPRQPKPWPIRLLNQLGVTDDQQATRIVLSVAIVGIIFAVYLFFSATGPAEVEEVDRAILLEMERHSI